MAKFNIGDRVKLINPYYFYKEVGLENGFVGTVVDVLISDGYAIKFDHWHNGWGEDDSIWWIPNDMLEKLEGEPKMSKELEALERLGSLIENLTRIDYMPLELLRQEIKQLLIKTYEESNGIFFQLKEDLKRNEPIKPTLDEDSNYRCARCHHIVDNHYCSDCGGAVDWSDEK